MEFQNEKSQDPRRLFANKLIKAGINAQKADWIALDVGMDVVDKEYLMRWGIKGKRLKIVERLIMNFYMGRLN